MARKKETVFQRENGVHCIAGQVHQVSIRKALQEGDDVAFPWALLLQSTRGEITDPTNRLYKLPSKAFMIHRTPASSHACETT